LFALVENSDAPRELVDRRVDISVRGTQLVHCLGLTVRKKTTTATALGTRHIHSMFCIRAYFIEKRGSCGLDAFVKILHVVLQLARFRAQGAQLVHRVNEFLFPLQVSILLCLWSHTIRSTPAQRYLLMELANVVDLLPLVANEEGKRTNKLLLLLLLKHRPAS
jgi:hypothetical protein